MRSTLTSNSSSRRRRGKASLTMLAALCALAAGAQALAPASAGAVTAQGTGSTCVHYDFLPPGSGFRSDGTPCTILATSGGGGAEDSGAGTPSSSSGGMRGYEVVEIRGTAPLADDTPSLCVLRPGTCTLPSRGAERSAREAPTRARRLVRRGRTAPKKNEKVPPEACWRIKRELTELQAGVDFWRGMKASGEADKSPTNKGVTMALAEYLRALTLFDNHFIEKLGRRWTTEGCGPPLNLSILRERPYA